MYIILTFLFILYYIVYAIFLVQLHLERLRTPLLFTNPCPSLVSHAFDETESPFLESIVRDTD